MRHSRVIESSRGPPGPGVGVMLARLPSFGFQSARIAQLLKLSLIGSPQAPVRVQLPLDLSALVRMPAEDLAEPPGNGRPVRR